VLRAVVDDRMDGVESKTVEMKLLDPIQGVMDDEIAHRRAVRAVVVDRVAPRRCMTIGEERGSKQR
jgi:hypothetical protein